MNAFKKFNFSGSPGAYLTDPNVLKDWCYNKICAGQVRPEYIGVHGVGGALYPSLEFYDEPLRWFMRQKAVIYVMENWKMLLLNPDDDHNYLGVPSEDEVESEDEDVHDAANGRAHVRPRKAFVEPCPSPHRESKADAAGALPSCKGGVVEGVVAYLAAAIVRSQPVM